MTVKEAGQEKQSDIALQGILSQADRPVNQTWYALPRDVLIIPDLKQSNQKKDWVVG